jgi:ParB/RepB/Spo0J family partition protein
MKMTTSKEGTRTFVNIEAIEIEKGFNPRSRAKADQELLDEVKASGVIVPLIVRWKNKKKDSLHLIDGERRLDAAKQADLGSVPIDHRGFVGDTEALIIALKTSKGRKKLSQKDSVAAYKRLKRSGMEVDKIAEVMAVDKRTVSEAIRVEEKATKELKAATKKPPEKGGVPTRVAARAVGLPAKEQKKIIGKVAGKSTQAGLREVRKAEIKIGKKHTGKKSAQEEVSATDYKIAPDAAERCKTLEEALKRRLEESNTKVFRAQLLIIECIKGKMKTSDVFDWDNI